MAATRRPHPLAGVASRPPGPLSPLPFDGERIGGEDMSDVADQDQIDSAEVSMHSMIGTKPEVIATYACFTRIKARHPEATVESVLAGDYN